MFLMICIDGIYRFLFVGIEDCEQMSFSIMTPTPRAEEET
jgi:hypothetical protein